MDDLLTVKQLSIRSKEFSVFLEREIQEKLYKHEISVLRFHWKMRENFRRRQVSLILNAVGHLQDKIQALYTAYNKLFRISVVSPC